MGGAAETKVLLLCHGGLLRSASQPQAVSLPPKKTASGVPNAVTDTPHLHITGSTEVTQPTWCRSARWQSHPSPASPPGVRPAQGWAAGKPAASSHHAAGNRQDTRGQNSQVREPLISATLLLTRGSSQACSWLREHEKCFCPHSCTTVSSIPRNTGPALPRCSPGPSTAQEGGKLRSFILFLSCTNFIALYPQRKLCLEKPCEPGNSGLQTGKPSLPQQRSSRTPVIVTAIKISTCFWKMSEPKT